MTPKFVNDKPARLIIAIARNQGKTATEIAKGMGYNYGEIGVCLKLFKDLGLIMAKQQGRTKKIYTTTSGLELAGAMEDVLKAIEKSVKK